MELSCVEDKEELVNFGKMKVSFEVSCQIIVCLTHYIMNMDTKGKREQSKLKDEELFGKMKGSGDVKASTIRQNDWQAIADILNA